MDYGADQERERPFFPSQPDEKIEHKGPRDSAEEFKQLTNKQ